MIFFGTREELREDKVWDCSRAHFLDHMRLWFAKEGSIGGSRAENTVTFLRHSGTELSSRPIPLDTEAVRALANNPGCVDLYTWLTWSATKRRTLSGSRCSGRWDLRASWASRNMRGSGNFGSVSGSGWNGTSPALLA